MDNISMGLNEFKDVIAFKFPNFYGTVLFSYLDFLPYLHDSYSFISMLNVHFFTHWWIFIRCFNLFKLVFVFNLVYIYL